MLRTMPHLVQETHWGTGRAHRQQPTDRRRKRGLYLAPPPYTRQRRWMMKLALSLVLSALVAIPSSVSLSASHTVPQASQAAVGYVEQLASSKVWLGRYTE